MEIKGHNTAPNSGAQGKRATSITENVGIVEKQKSNTIQRNIWHVLSFVVQNVCCSMFTTPCSTQFSLSLSLAHPFYLRSTSKLFFFTLNSFLIPIRFTFCSLDPVLVLALMMLVLDLINAYRKRSAAFLTLHPDSMFLFRILFSFISYTCVFFFLSLLWSSRAAAPSDIQQT